MVHSVLYTEVSCSNGVNLFMPFLNVLVLAISWYTRAYPCWCEIHELGKNLRRYGRDHYVRSNIKS
ncbi:hypothetical protein ANCDUO_05233 [Ancylostoma duodenale]|uniref:Uncharacterized protein n=1 Tax=Ancylostoma duodenale TaxID=51022 RepID=A0A0C2DP60_9BILA|nr:hypothetical protein ANCDUO_05233 [Ancylostoma duodenale]